MKVLVIYAHPDPESFNASLHREVCGWRMMLMGNPPRKMFKLSMWACTRCREIQWHAIYSMDKTDDRKRPAFLKRSKMQLRDFNAGRVF